MGDGGRLEREFPALHVRHDRHAGKHIHEQAGRQAGLGEG